MLVRPPLLVVIAAVVGSSISSLGLLAHSLSKSHSERVCAERLGCGHKPCSLRKLTKRCREEADFCKRSEGHGEVKDDDAGPFQFQPSSKRDEVFVSCPWPKDVTMNRVISCSALGLMGLLILALWARRFVCTTVVLCLLASVLSAASLSSDAVALRRGSDYCQHSRWIDRHWHFDFDTERTAGPFLAVVCWDVVNVLLWFACAVLLRQFELKANKAQGFGKLVGTDASAAATAGAPPGLHQQAL